MGLVYGTGALGHAHQARKWGQVGAGGDTSDGEDTLANRRRMMPSRLDRPGLEP